MLPTKAFEPADARRYNRLMAADFDNVRDFLVLHFHVTQRDDTPYWRELAAMTPPDSLAERLAIHRATGRIFRESDELFTKTSWLAVMEGQEVGARDDDPLALAVPHDVAAARLARIAELAGQAVERMPTHGDFIAAHCLARTPEPV
jgi:tryptophan halogenase